jgi:hypothetical protein
MTRDQFRATLRQSAGAATEQLAPNNPESRSFGDDRPWHQRALEPELVPAPPAGSSNLWPMMLRLGAVCGIAALVAAAVVFLFNPKQIAHKIVQADEPLRRAPPSPKSRSTKMKSIRRSGAAKICSTTAISPRRGCCLSAPAAPKRRWRSARPMIRMSSNGSGRSWSDPTSRRRDNGTSLPPTVARPRQACSLPICRKAVDRHRPASGRYTKTVTRKPPQWRVFNLFDRKVTRPLCLVMRVSKSFPCPSHKSPQLSAVLAALGG